jgi:putative ABC transport system ATP-binding protein
MAGHMCPAISVSGLGITLPGRVLFSDVSFDVELGEVVAIMGPSGIGKSTLLSCLAGVTRPSAGSVAVCGTNLSNLSVTERALLRQRKIGFVFQFGELLPELNVLDNVSLPLRLSGASRSVAEESARVWVKRVGLESKLGTFPAQLSGGELQRIAVCRALVHGPSLVLADEPTGSLDEKNAQRIVALLCSTVRESKASLVFVTHDSAVAEHADRILRVRNCSLTPSFNVEPPQP